jgi:hypothetical protein
MIMRSLFPVLNLSWSSKGSSDDKTILHYISQEEEKQPLFDDKKNPS